MINIEKGLLRVPVVALERMLEKARPTPQKAVSRELLSGVE
jgi:hypothetical protein